MTTAALALFLLQATPTPPWWPTWTADMTAYWRRAFETATASSPGAADTAEAHAWASQAAHARGTPWGYPNFTPTPTTEPTPTLAPTATATAAPTRKPRPTAKPTRTPQPTATQRPAVTVTPTPTRISLRAGAWFPLAFAPRRGRR